jgi:AcrR family transcriptional regulator
MKHKRSDDADGFTIRELVSRTGVPATTIHHYRHIGLLPPPRRAAPNRFLYDHTHEQALRLVRRLRERRGLPLDRIRDVLPELLAGDEDAFRADMWEAVLARHGDRPVVRAAVVEAARRAFGSHGYADVNMTDIADAVGIGKGTLYRHFPSKDQLFLAAVEASGVRAAQAITAQLPCGPVDLARAASVVADALRPDLGLHVELIRRAVTDDAACAAAARRLVAELATVLAPVLPRRSDASEAVDRGLAQAVHDALARPRAAGPRRAAPDP